MPPLKKPQKNETVRPVKYPEVAVQECTGDKPITALFAKGLLGWKTEEEYEAEELAKLDPKDRKDKDFSYGGDYDFKDAVGRKVRCLNNDRNRPFKDWWARALAQDILQRHFMFNGESIIIGETGRVLSAQHRLVGLALAAQIWAGEGSLVGVGADQSRHWKQLWPTEPTIESIIVYGVKETPEVTRTLDNVMPRDLADVLYADTALYGKKSKGDRAALCRMAMYCVRSLWQRTGLKDDAFSPRLTNSEAAAYIDHHRHVKDAVAHIYDLYKKDWSLNTKRCQPGAASALLYLMGSSRSDPDVYAAAETPSERKLNWDEWDKAKEYWTYFCGAANEVLQVHHALAALHGEGGEHNPTREEKIGIIIRGWHAYAAGGRFTAEDLAYHPDLDYTTDDLGLKSYCGNVLVGGIDHGSKPARTRAETVPVDGGGPNANDPSPEEVQAEAERLRLARENGEAPKRGRKKKPPVPEEEQPVDDTTGLPPEYFVDKENGTPEQTEEEMAAEDEAARARAAELERNDRELGTEEQYVEEGAQNE